MAEIVLVTSPWAVEAIQVKRGDTIIIRVPPGASQDEIEHTLLRLRDGLVKHIPEHQIIIVLGDLRVEALDENMMRQSGWTKQRS